MAALGRGDVRAVLVKHNICVHPEDAEHFILNHKDLKPPPGWVIVSRLPKELGRSKVAVNQWIRRNRNTVEVRRFLHPTRNRPTPYIREADAARYRAIVTNGSEKHVGHSYRIKSSGRTRQRVLEGVTQHHGPVTAAEIAAELGLTDDLCNRVLTKLHGEDMLKRCGKGVAHHPYSYLVRVVDENDVTS